MQQEADQAREESASRTELPDARTGRRDARTDPVMEQNLARGSRYLL